MTELIHPPITQTPDINWEKEATLPSTSAYSPSRTSNLLSRPRMTEILLTGVETPSGIHMLLELLSTRPNAKISLLGTHAPLTLAAIRTLLTSLSLPIPPTLDSRVEILSNASLAEPNLGLTKGAFEALGRKLHAIYHFGNSIMLIKPYAELRRINVEAVHEIIRLAVLNTVFRTEIHYLATWSVLHLQSWHSTTRTHVGGRSAEDEVIVKKEVSPIHFVPGRGEKFAYFPSRWVAEMLVTEADRRGIPAAIYRSSAMLGDVGGVGPAATGSDGGDISFADNFTVALVRAVARSGEVPNLGGLGIDVDVVPAEYLVRVIARLAGSDAGREMGGASSSGSVSEGVAVFHIRNPGAVALGDVLSGVETGAGRQLNVLGVEEWIGRRVREGAFDEVNAAVIRGYLDAGHPMFALDDGWTRKVLEKIGWSGEEEEGFDLEGMARKLVGRI